MPVMDCPMHMIREPDAVAGIAPVDDLAHRIPNAPAVWLAAIESGLSGYGNLHDSLPSSGPMIQA